MGFDTFDMGNKPYTASIMLKLRIIEPSIYRNVHIFRHNFSNSFKKKATEGYQRRI